MSRHPSKSDPGGTHDTTHEDLFKESALDNKSVDDDLLGMREAYQLPRDDEDDVYLGPKGQASKKKTKLKKAPRETPLAMQFQYANKPTGASSSSKFCGMDEEDDFGDSYAFDQQEQAVVGQGSGGNLVVANQDEMDGDNWYQAQAGQQMEYAISGGDPGYMQAIPSWIAPASHIVGAPVFCMPQMHAEQMDVRPRRRPNTEPFENFLMAGPNSRLAQDWSTEDGIEDPIFDEDQITSSIRDGIFGIMNKNRTGNQPNKPEEPKETVEQEDGEKAEDESENGVEEEDEDETSEENGEEGDEESEDETCNEASLIDQQQEIQHLKDQLMNMKKSADSTKKAMQLKIDDLTKERDDTMMALEKLRVSRQSEHTKHQHEKTRLKDEAEKRKADLKKVQSELDEKTAFCNRCQSEVNELRLDKERLLRAVVESTQKCKCKVDLNGMKQRAIVAEAALLKLKKLVELRGLEKACRDADLIIAHLTTVIDKARPEDAGSLIDYKNKWQLNWEILKRNIKIVEKSFDEQIGQVEQGQVSLATLTPITIPPTPAPPRPPAKPSVNPELTKTVTNTMNRASTPSSPASSSGTGTSMGYRQQSPAFGQPPPPVMNPFDQRPTFGRGGTFGQSGIGLQSTAAPQASANIPPPVARKLSQATPVVPPGFPATTNMMPPVRRKDVHYRTEEEKRQMREAFKAFNLAEPHFPDDEPTADETPSASGFRPIAPAGSTGNMGAISGNGGGFGGRVPFMNQSKNLAQSQPESSASAQKTKLERLIDEVVAKVPHLTRDNVLKCVEQFRELQESKSLRGIKFPVLVDGVCEFSKRVYPPPMRSQQPIATAPYGGHVVPPPMLGIRPPPLPLFGIPSGAESRAAARASAAIGGTSGFNTKTQSVQQQLQHRELATQVVDDECFVCLEKLTMKKTLTMDCKHIAHEECLHEWFTNQNSCPMCRSLYYRHDEYPALGKK